MSERKVAFFDIDGTVFRSSLLIELVEGLIRAGIFPASARAEYQASYTAWRNREGTYHTYIGAVIETYMHHIKGVHYADLADAGREIVATQGRHVYQYTRNLIKDLKRQNYFIVAISQSPKTILDEFCTEYGFDKIYGRMYEIGPSDKFTGGVIDEHLIENKANIVARVFDRNPLTKEGSIGVGDTDGDIPLLESVEQPICFNPNQILFDHAKRAAWPIVIERKDVMYEL